MAIALALLVTFLSIRTDLFLTATNLNNNVARGSAVTLILAAGTTVLLTTGIIDLSIGGLLALSSMVLVGFMSLSLPPVVSVLATLLCCALVTALTNGVLIARVGLNFFVVTLGTMSAFRALAALPTAGLPETLTDKTGDSFVEGLGNSTVGGVPVSIIIAAGVVVSLGLMMRFTILGRAIVTVGGNEEAARLAGINVARVRITVFAINGLCVGIAAILLSGRTFSASPSAGAGIELSVIAAVLLGGSSFVGGRSTLVGTVLGVMFIAVLENGLNLLQVDVLWQGVVTGSVLIAAVALDRARRFRS